MATSVPIEVVTVSEGAVWPLVQLEIGGTTVRFLIDTGTSAIAVSDELARTLPPGGHRSGRVWGQGQGQHRCVLLPDIAIGDAVLRGENAIVVSVLDRTDEDYGVKIDGILGAPLFLDAVVTIDYPAQVLEIDHVESSLAAERWIAIQMRRGLPVLELDVLDSGTDRYLLDTGTAEEMLALPQSKLRSSLGQRLDRLPRSVSEGGVCRYGLVPHLDLAGASFSDVCIAFPDIAPRESHAWNVAGLVGSGLFVDCRLSVDYRNCRVGVTRCRPPSQTGAWGLGVLGHEDALEVTQVLAGSPAEQCGIRRGDYVERVDGLAEPIGVSAFYRYLAGKKSITVDVRRGAITRRLHMTRAPYLPRLN